MNYIFKKILVNEMKININFWNTHLQLSVLRPRWISKQLKSNQGNERDRGIA